MGMTARSSLDGGNGARHLALRVVVLASLAPPLPLTLDEEAAN
jgi:hypothetical protein